MKIKIDDTLVINNDVLEDCSYDLVILGLAVQSWAKGFFGGNPDIEKVEVERD